MNFPGDCTWAVSSGDGGTFALFVRDALGISTPVADSIPRLTPPVLPVTGVLLPAEFAQDWDRWWHADPSAGAREPIGITDGLREAYQRWYDPRSPGSTHLRDEIRMTFSNLLQELVADLEQELGHKPVFRLDVLQVPVVGQFWRRLTKDKVLVSEELMRSRNLIAPLETVIRELAGAR